METVVRQILEKENIAYKTIEKAISGFTSTVYFAGDAVIKIAFDKDSKKKLLKEISVYRNIKSDSIPRYIADGKTEECGYLILSKEKGVGLYSVWHTLHEEERERCIEKITEILKQFHRQRGDFLAPEYKREDWENCITESLEEQKQRLDRLGIDTRPIVSFLEKNDLFQENVFGLVYNDAHFDNFLYDNGTLRLIDFDRVLYAPIDYEMLIFKSMCDTPKKFASDETVVFDKDFEYVYRWFQKYYRQMFTIPKIEERIKVYQFLYLCRQALKMENREMGTAWAESLVKGFPIYT